MKKFNGVIFIGMGFELVMIVLGASYVGEVIDRHQGWSGYATSGLTILALIGWMVHLIVLLTRMNKSQQSQGDKFN